ncbi:hypothetical protein ACHAQA_000549 [Verticillium albo-atrum]
MPPQTPDLQGDSLLDYISKEPLPPRWCQGCEETDGNLQRCAGCKAALYCSKPCQKHHWPWHKNTCKLIKDRRKRYEDAEDSLRNAEPDDFTPPNVFDTSVGHFWDIGETRPYMRARYDLTQFLCRTDVRVALEEVLEHQFDMLRLCRGDNIGVRSEMPATMLRLGREQEAYDFIKWWVFHQNDQSYLKNMPDSPYLDIKDANALEPVELFTAQRYPDTFHLCSLTLLKIRLLLDLQKAQKVINAAENKSVEEKVALLQAEDLSRAITRHEEALSTLAGDPKAVVDELTKQARELVACTHKTNSHLWEMIINPGDDFGSPPEPYSRGTREEADVARGYTFRVWRGTPGAIELLASLR